MATTKGLYEEAQRGTKLVVTAPHAMWLETPEEEQIYSAEAIEFVDRVMRREFKHTRSGRFSPSSMGECHRRVMLEFAGAPAEQPAIDNQEMMDHGSWTHLKWQAEGITLGYMTAVEVWFYEADLLNGGSVDALLIDGSIFELKSKIWNAYHKIVNVNLWPDLGTLLQLHDYFLLSDIDVASVVYEDRGAGKFHEFRIARDPKIELEVLKLLSSYLRYAEDDSLPPVLDMCQSRKGETYHRCPFRRVCLQARSVSQFGVIT